MNDKMCLSFIILRRCDILRYAIKGDEMNKDLSKLTPLERAKYVCGYCGKADGELLYKYGADGHLYYRYHQACEDRNLRGIEEQEKKRQERLNRGEPS